MTVQFADSPAESIFPYRRLWQAVLEHRTADIEMLCRSGEQGNGTCNPVVVMLVQRLQTPSELPGFLTGLSDVELKSEGWVSLFFGLARLVLGQSPAALRLLQKASGLPECRVPALVHMAAFYLAHSDVSRARVLLEEGLELAKNIGELHLLKARLYLRDRACVEARQEVDIAKAIGCYSLLNLARYDLELLVVQDEPEKAINAAVELLRNGLGGVPKEGIASVGLRTLTTCGALDEAGNYLDQALENDPNNIVFLTHKGELAALKGQFKIAGLVIQRALAQDKDNLYLLHKKASLAGQGISHEEGLKTLEKMMVLSVDFPAPIRAGYMVGFGDIYFEQDEFQRAEIAYRDTLAVDNDCLQALAGLSRILTILGKRDEAEAIQNRMYRIAPVRAVQLMISSDRIPEGDQEIQRMKGMVANLANPLQMRASLNFSLAMVYQKRGEHLAAITYADKANEIARSFVSYDHQQEAQQVDRIIARMSKVFFDSRKGFGSESELPVFILGMPRSGTTLVEQILGGHSRVFPGGELGMIPSMWGRLMVWEKRLGSEYQGLPGCVMELTQNLSQQFSRKVENEYLELMPEKAAEVHLTDKLPHNFKNIGLIKLLFPKARIIYCRRSSGGIALSNYFTDYKSKYGGMGFAYDKEWIGSEIANCQRLMAHWMDLFENEIHVIDYEELVENPQSTVQALLAYMNLEWEDQVMAFHSLDRAVKTASVMQVRKPMYTSSKEKWLHYEESLQQVFRSIEERLGNDLPQVASLPNHEPGLFLKGMDLLKAECLEESENVFQGILDLYPRHAAAMHMLGVSYLKQGKIRSAHQCMERSIQLNPNNPTWYNNLAIILDHIPNSDAAEKMRQQGKKMATKAGYISNL